MTTRRKLLLIIIVVIAAIGGLIFYAVQQSTYTAMVNIEATPLSSSVTIDGHHANQGITKISPGTIVVTVSLPGFSNFTTKVKIAAGETKYIGVVLQSNTSDTSNWFEQHPEDQAIAEKIASKQFDATSQKQIKAEPFLKELPFTAAGFEFKIDYGTPPANSDKSTIFIQSDTQTGRDDALVWIRSRGYDPSKMNIVYTTINN